MSKITLEEVEQVLSQHKVADAPAIMDDLQKILDELAAEREAEKANKVPWEYVVVLHDPNGELKAQKKDEVLSAYVVQHEDGVDPGTILSTIADAATAQNDTAKRRKTMLSNMREIFEGLKSKFLKEKKIRIKTKEPVRVLLTTGNLK